MSFTTKAQNKVGNQLSLFTETEIEETEKPINPVHKDIAQTVGEKNASFSDPAFAINKTLPVHRWVPWIAGFSSDFVRHALHTYLDHKGTVLDPFAGVGTTLVEAILAGHNAIGFEINPYPALASRIKLSAYTIDIEAIKREIQHFKIFYNKKISSNIKPNSVPPSGFKTRTDFYSPLVLNKVLIIQDFIETIEDTRLQELFKLSFAATMVRYSNYSYEPSLGRRVSSGKAEIIEFPVMETILAKIVEVEEDIIWLQSKLSNKEVISSIINDSFFHHERHLEPASVDLIITSPPYLNNYHYNRNTRPQLYWLKYMKVAEDLKPLENANFGKYWQTVRDLEYLGLEFTLPETDIEERLQLLRSLHREKKTYGGNGWANYAASYFNDCYKLTKGIQYCLKPGGTALVVLGNSILQGVTIPTDEYFAKIAQLAGLELVKIHMTRTTRVGNSIIQSAVRVGKAKDSQQLYEAVIELRKLVNRL